ncbi:hypothetical protein Tco_1203936 [Tanacetum coccineum]
MGVVPMQQLNHNFKNKEKLKAISTGVKTTSSIAQPDGSFSINENAVRSTKDVRSLFDNVFHRGLFPFRSMSSAADVPAFSALSGRLPFFHDCPVIRVAPNKSLSSCPLDTLLLSTMASLIPPGYAIQHLEHALRLLPDLQMSHNTSGSNHSSQTALMAFP